MRKGKIKDVSRTSRQLLFCDTTVDDLALADKTLQACHFLRVGARDATFRGCALTQCVFEDSYLRKASFHEVALTGSRFRHCNLEKASFSGCDLRYCTFESTLLDPNEIRANLPKEPNLRRTLARNLRVNFENLGDRVAADVFLGIEIEAHEQELRNRAMRRTQYYREHYTGFAPFIACLQLCGSRLSGAVWGYGHRVRRLIVSYVILTLVFAGLAYGFGLLFTADTSREARSLSFWESVYQAFGATLGTVTPFVPASLGAYVLQVWESFLGTLFLAMLAAAAYRRIAR